MNTSDFNTLFASAANTGWLDGVRKDSSLDLKKKKDKKKCCEKFRKGKRCGSCPMKGCA